MVARSAIWGGQNRSFFSASFPGSSAPSLYSLPTYAGAACACSLFCAVVSFYSLDLFSLRLASSYSLTGQNKLKLLIGFCPALGWSFTLPPGKMGFVNERISCSAWGKRHALSKARRFTRFTRSLRASNAPPRLVRLRRPRSVSLIIQYSLNPPPASGRQAKTSSYAIFRWIRAILGMAYASLSGNPKAPRLFKRKRMKEGTSPQLFIHRLPSLSRILFRNIS